MLSIDPSSLRAHRERAGLSREQVAVDVSRGYTSVVSYESGVVTPPAAVLAKLAGLYGCSVADFFTDTPAGVA